jgi:hypothetical protein
MNWIPNIFRRRRLYDDLSEEIRLHIEERAEQLMREGMSRNEAEQAARRAFGNRTLLEERSREVWQWPTLESIVSDVRFAFRQLRRSPGFTIAAVLTLALAIGANAVVFSILDAFLLRPLNVARPSSLYELQHGTDISNYQSYPDYLDLRDRNRTFDDLAAYTADEVGLESGGDPTEVWIEEASGNYFDALGLQPYLGRFFHAADEHGANSAPYIVLSYDYWHTHFQDDRSVVGRVVRLNRHPFTILGVAPPAFNGILLFFNPAMFVPLVEHPSLGGNDLTTRGDRWIFDTVGHLKSGVTPAQAVADLNSIGKYLEKTYPKDESKMTFRLVRPGLYGDYLGRPVRAFMAGLMLLTALILLAACANLGSLFASRAADRSREVALRLALGSARSRILRTLFTEAVLISLTGGAIGLLGSVGLLHALSAWRPFTSWPIYISVNPDAKVYLAALLLALVSGLLFGAVPVRQVLRTNPYEVIKAGSGRRFGKRMSAREVLLVAQIAICAVLVTSSLVAVRGLGRSLPTSDSIWTTPCSPSPTLAWLATPAIECCRCKSGCCTRWRGFPASKPQALPTPCPSTWVSAMRKFFMTTRRTCDPSTRPPTHISSIFLRGIFAPPAPPCCRVGISRGRTTRMRRAWRWSMQSSRAGSSAPSAPPSAVITSCAAEPGYKSWASLKTANITT